MVCSRGRCVALMMAVLPFMAVWLLAEQRIKAIRVRDRKILANLSVGPMEHQLGFEILRIGTAKVPVGPRLRFVTPDRGFLWISDIVKKRLVLMTMGGKMVKAIVSPNGYLPWDLSGFMDKEGSFYFWDKIVSTITKVTTKGTVESINLDWSQAERLVKHPIKRDEHAFRPRCWLDDHCRIYVWVNTKVWFKGDDVAGRLGLLVRFNQKGEPEQVVLKDDIDIDFVDRRGQIYVTKFSPFQKLSVSVYDSYGRLIHSFVLESLRQERPSLGVRGKYLTLRFNDGMEIWYEAVTKRIHAQSPGIYSLLGIRHVYEGGCWRSWTIDYLDESVVYLLSASDKNAILESVTLELES